MKFKESISFSCTPQQIWSLFENPEKMSGWNPVFTQIEGQFENDAELKIKLAYFASPVRMIQARVTSWVPGKYLSFTYSRGPGTWWFEVEHIFRIAKNKGDEQELVSEIYANGLRLRVGKLKFRSLFQRTLVKINDRLKEELGAFTRA